MQVQCLAEPNYAMQCKRFGVRGRVTSRAEICDKVWFCLCNQPPYRPAAVVDTVPVPPNQRTGSAFPPASDPAGDGDMQVCSAGRW